MDLRREPTHRVSGAFGGAEQFAHEGIRYPMVAIVARTSRAHDAMVA
jgi:hypothetical protein